MATLTTTELAGETGGTGKAASRRSAADRKRASTGAEKSGARFFLGKADAKTPVLEREFATENDALIEALKTGQTYFVVSEWKAVADLSKEVPQIRKDIVRREDKDSGPAVVAIHAGRGTPAQAS